jgi:hypothetical protein
MQKQETGFLQAANQALRCESVGAGNMERWRHAGWLGGVLAAEW